MERNGPPWLGLLFLGMLLVASCGEGDAERGSACDPCGEGVDIMDLFQGVQSTCGTGLACVAATFSLQPFGPGVCVRTTGSTTCQGTITDSSGTRTNQCTYTATDHGYDVFCR
jgi:hypothetical protein